MENTNIENTTVENATEELDVVEELKRMKETMVNKEDYNKAVEERNKYFKALLNGEGLTQTEAPVVSVDVDGLQHKLFEKDLTNLEYVETALKLRDAIIDAEGKDIFVGSGKNFVPEPGDFETAQKVADAFKHCVDTAEGDPEIFTRELMRITVDSAPSVKINPKIKR